MFYCVPYEVVVRDYCDGDDFVPFAFDGDYSYNGRETASSSSSSSSSSTSTSTSRKINFDELPLMLTHSQQAQITHMISMEPVDCDEDVNDDDNCDSELDEA